MAYVKALRSEIADWFSDFHFCMDLNSLVLYGGEVGDNMKMNISVYDCTQGESPVPCNQTLQPHDVYLQIAVAEETLDIKLVDNPFGYNHKPVDYRVLSNKLRFTTVYAIKQVDFLDDRGWFSENWRLRKYLTNSAKDSKSISGPFGPENIIMNYVLHGKIFYKDFYWFIQINTTNSKTEIRRSYFNMMEVFSAVGGLLQFMVIGISTTYYFYNYFRLIRHAILYSIIGKQSLYPKEYHIKKDYNKLFWCGLMCKCCKCCVDQNDALLEERKLVMSDCFTCIDEKMDVKNFLHDSMDFIPIKNLLMKSRHKLLMPCLVLNITRNKTKVGSGYKSAFVRNMCERVDQPVFTLEEAVKQLHDTTEERPQTEKDMDEFF
jgi:hypothetical protein